MQRNATRIASRLYSLGIHASSAEAQFQDQGPRDDLAAYSLRFDGRRVSFAAVLRARPPQLEASIHGPGPRLCDLDDRALCRR